MKLVRVFAAAAFVLLACEIAGRLFVPASWSPRIFRPSDAAPGFALVADFKTHYRQVHLTIDSTGHRAVVPASRAALARGVHVIGDAQVFGLGLDDEATVPSRLQALLGPAYRVVNDGVPGYGPHAYAEESLRLPRDGLAIVLVSERDDLRAAYGRWSPSIAHCGYLVERGSPSSRLPCLVLASGIARSVSYLRATELRDGAPLPLDYDDGSTFAARVLGLRVRRLLERSKRRLASNLIIAYVPWDGAIEPSRIARDDPRLRARSSVTFVDEAGVANALLRAGGERFQDDGQLSVYGADIVARALANEVRRRVREQKPGSKR